MKKLLLFGACLLVYAGMHAQGLVPQSIPCTEPKVYTPGYIPGSVPELDFSGYNCVDLFGPIPAGGDNVIEKGHVDIVAGKYIHIGPGVHIGPMVDSTPPYTAPQYTHIYIGHNDFDVVWFEPNSTPGEVGQYEKLELGVKLPSPIDSMVYNYVHHGTTTEWLNPFDPTAVKVEAVFNHLNSFSENDINYTRTVEGFYYKEYFHPSDADNDWTEDTTSYPFRIRYAPTATGNWVVNIKIYTPLDTFEVLPIHFNCTSSGNPGYVHVGNPNKNFLQLGSNTFYPIGQNLPWPYDKTVWEDGLYTRGIQYPWVYNQYIDIIKTFKSEGANSFRVVIAPWTYEIEFEELGNYGNRMKHAWELDRLLELADSLGMKIELNLQLHGAFEVGSTFDLKNWDWKLNTCDTDAAYAYATDLSLTGVKDFYTDTDAKTNYKNRLRYLMSRYNYSTSIIAYEIMSEANNMGKMRNYHTTPQCGPDGIDYSNPYHEDPTFATAAGNWLTEMAGFIKSDMGCTEHLLSTSYTGSPFADPQAGVLDGGTPRSVMYRGDSSFINPVFDLGSYNAYGLEVSSPKGSTLAALDYSYGFYTSDNNIAKPLIHSEFGTGEDSTYVCGKDVEYVKHIYIYPFTGLALAFNWQNQQRTDLFHHYGNMGNFMNLMLSLHNISSEYWKPSYGTINVASSTEVPQVEYYCLENAVTAIDHSFGIVVNRTYNAFSEYSDNTEIQNDSCTHYFGTLGTDKYPTDLRHKISVADIDGDHTLNLVHYDPGAYLVEWYNPFYGTLIRTDPCTVSVLNENLELDFPDLNLVEDANSDGIMDETFLPFVYYYAYPVGARSMFYTQNNSSQANDQPWGGLLTNCQVYPNPANHFTPVNVNCGRTIQKIELYSTNGHLLHNFKEIKSVLSLPELARGVYYLKITLNDQSEENHKIVVLD